MTDRPAAESPRFRLLLAEDNAVNQTVTTKMLEKLGYAVDVVANGREAVEAVAATPYAAVLMDVNMPEMDGLEAARAIRARWNRSGPAIIALTATNSPELEAECLAAGMTGYLGKPITRDQLDRTIRSVAPGAAPAAPDASEGVRHQMHEFELMFGMEMVHELLGLFLSDTPARIESLRTALGNGAAEDVRRVAHAIKGASATMGMATLAAEAGALETEARNGDLSKGGEHLARIIADYQAVEAYAHGLGIRPGEPA